MRKLLYLFLALILFSCKESETQRIARLTQAWTGKSIYYPVDSVFESFEQDSIRTYSLKRTDYTVVTYIDPASCSNGKLHLKEWKEFVNALKTFPKGKATCLFYIHSKDRNEIVQTLKTSGFNYPVCIDEEGVFDKLNHFPTDSIFKTFLLDDENKVLAMGNPAESEEVKERYLDIIAGKEKS